MSNLEHDEADVTSSGAWRSSFGDGMLPGLEWFTAPAPVLACRLLGQRLISTVDGRRTSGRIVETEAYLGSDDPASHAAVLRGRTRRNASMFASGGTSYLYFTYGMHWCFNVVAGPAHQAQAVLIRALEPMEGLSTMSERRGRATDLASGPARLCQALGLDGALDGHVLTDAPLWIEGCSARTADAIGVSGRIGIRKAMDLPLRFFIRDHPDVSRSDHPPARMDTLHPAIAPLLHPVRKATE